MKETQPNNPLHGKTLEHILTYLVAAYDWDGLYEQVKVNCFQNNPSVKSSLKFLRKNQWARTKIENLYIDIVNE